MNNLIFSPINYRQDRVVTTLYMCMHMYVNLNLCSYYIVDYKYMPVVPRPTSSYGEIFSVI